MSDPFILPDGNVSISFSGGRTSAYMLHRILDANDGLPDRARVLFANTGREMPETIDFVARCEREWNVPIVWLEYTRREGKVGFDVVNHNSASRNGEPFEALLERHNFMPSSYRRFCTGELKVETMRRYMVQTLGWRKWQSAVGIRADESHRAKQRDPNKDSKESLFWPLLSAQVDKYEVAAFWKRAPFDLRLPIINGKTVLGNCDLCFLKSEANRAAIIRAYPERAQWWIDQETKKGLSFIHREPVAELADFIKRQGDWVFSDKAFFCQADDGECV